MFHNDIKVYLFLFMLSSLQISILLFGELRRESNYATENMKTKDQECPKQTRFTGLINSKWQA